MASGTFVYYCSGHGYGHATRVSAFACHLLSLPEEAKPTIYIVSSAPKHVFSESIAVGAHYRYAEIDPVIVQPLAYRVDRQKSVQVLKQFLSNKKALLDDEVRWLIRVNARCVLSDAAFLGCLAAKTAGVPSILITNFSFDSVYSYLATTFTDQIPTLQPNQFHLDAFIPDIPVPEADLMPLVEQIHSGYRCADLLLELPGNIPIPSFSLEPSLPASSWVNAQDNRFYTNIVKKLSQSYISQDLYPSVPFPPSTRLAGKRIPRMVKSAPLLVRPPSPYVYTREGRSHLLSSIGVPSELHDPEATKVLIVSFGGQVFRTPSRSGSRSPSRLHSRKPSAADLPKPIQGLGISSVNLPPSYPGGNDPLQLNTVSIDSPSHDGSIREFGSIASPRLATSSHIWIPGAPPASKISGSPCLSRTPSTGFPSFNTIPPTPAQEFAEFVAEDEIESWLLPDSSWIAIVCGVTKDQWESQGDSELPEGFYVAPRDVYMPDLTAVADVLLGKLGYGTVSECVDSATPFVYVSRPLFIEEHGLRLLLDNEGVGVELSRDSYEAGEWAHAVQDAFLKGQAAKIKKREEMAAGVGINTRAAQGKKMAASVVEWVNDCWRI
ncbi:uncharacterized protein EV420DRAFT_1494846 [Desarmillaria tabescens]|uniref:L-arabinokinase n=1 Tax=Armillaria tabescens TaxID=1929756 RepID=A0AA39NPN9_ARMTA|nr:uncharacterized protein EV420DRAFT_1494846 [Desarmillaria tabescens]KAK0469503.1 hypothetical protein EV420DRAFT_1494846 [Desarmillaria tabescens]